MFQTTNQQYTYWQPQFLMLDIWRLKHEIFLTVHISSAAIGSNCQFQKLSRIECQVLNLLNSGDVLNSWIFISEKFPKDAAISMQPFGIFEMGCLLQDGAPSRARVQLPEKSGFTMVYGRYNELVFMGGYNGLFKNQLITGRPHPVQVIPNSLSSSVGLAPLDPFRYVWTSAKFYGDGNVIHVILVGGFNHLEKLGRIIPYIWWKINYMFETTNKNM